MKLSRLPPLAMAVILLVAGGLASIREEDTSVGVSLLAAGFVVLGAWLTIEVWEHRDKDRNVDIDTRRRQDDA